MHPLKALLLTLLFFTALTDAHSQRRPLELGLEAAPTLRRMFGNEILQSRSQPTIGFAGGVTFQAPLTDHLSIRTGLAFERKGGYARSEAIDWNGNPAGPLHQYLNFDYLTAPVLLRFSFGKEIRYFLDAGPYGAYLVRQATVNKGPSVPRTSYSEIALFKRLDAGLSAGIGVNIPLQTNLHLSFEFRNNIGLITISDVIVYNNGTVQTFSSQALLGLSWLLGPAE